MTPERATEILNTESKIMKGFKLIDVGCVRDTMTSDEVAEVKQVWDTMPGSSSFYDALWRIVQPNKVSPKVLQDYGI